MADFDPTLWSMSFPATGDLEAAKAGYEAAQEKRDAWFEPIKPTGEFGWKGRISAIIPKADFESINAACIWFTGAALVVEAERDNDQLWVTSPGYYEIIGP